MEPSAADRFIISSMTFSETPHRVSQPALVGSDEAVWIAQARAGSEQAWRHLVRAHQEAAFRLAYLLLRDAAAAEDVAQEAFVRAYLSLARFDETRPFRPWLLQITRNLARNYRRSLRRYLHHLTHWYTMARETAVTLPSQNQETNAQLLGQAVQKLPAKGQEIVYLRYFLELSEAETAVILNIPVGTVKSRLSRALRQLRGVIERDFPELRERGAGAREIENGREQMDETNHE